MTQLSLLALTKPDISTDVHRLRKPLRVKPRDAVADLEARILDGRGETVPGPRATESEDVPARLEHPEALGGPELAPGLECFPVERDGGGPLACPHAGEG